MKNSNSNSNADLITVRNGHGVSTLLLVAFVVLKLTGHITWSWIWVLSPYWLPLSIILVLLIAYVIIYIIVGKR